MKLLFVDEFKESKKNSEFYGLAAVLIDSSSYMKFKKGFYEKLKKLGWDGKIEIKGHYSFSNKKGDTRISIEERLSFVEKLFELSSSSNNKYTSASVYYTLDLFPKKTSEYEMYSKLLMKILGKLPKCSLSGNRNGKNNIIIFLDNNDSIDTNFISKNVEDKLISKNLFLVERCISLISGNKTPGIVFADHVAYFIHNYFKTSDFNDSNKDRIILLADKFSGDKISKEEQKELDYFMISIKKETKSISLLGSLKKMILVK